MAKGAASCEHRGPGALVGRDRELAVLRRFVASLSDGTGGALVVEGEPGLGKSALVDVLAAAAAAAGVRVARGHGRQLDAGRPFGPLIGALDLREASLDPGAAAIGRLLGDPAAEGWGVGDRILDHVERMASSAPLLLAVDDLQWADLSTLRALEAIAAQVAQLPIGLAIACRPTPRSTDLDLLLGSLGRHAEAEGLQLRTIRPVEVDGLLRAQAGAPPGPRLSRLAERAGGNPLFVVQLVASLQASGQLEVGEVAEAASDDVPVDLRVTIERRVRALEPATRKLLTVASVLGTTFSLEQLAAVTEEDVLVVADRLRAAFDDGLLGDDGTAGVAFRHDLVRDAVYASVPGAERTELHHVVGRRLAAIGAPAAHVAEHLALGAARGDVDAVKWLRKAGIAAAAHDTATAVSYLERAVALSSPADPRHHGLVAALVNQLVPLGRGEEAEQLSRAVLAETTDPTVETLLRFGLAQIIGFGRLEETKAEFLRGAAVAPEEPMRLSGLAMAAYATLCQGHVEEASQELGELLATAEAQRVVFVQAVASTVLGAARAACGDLEAGLALSRRGILLTGEADYYWGGVMFPHLYLAALLLAADRIGEARETLHVGRAIAAGRNLRVAVPAYDGSLALCEFLEGQWDDAATTATEAGRARREAGPGHPRIFGASIAGLIAAARGEAVPPEAADELDCVPLLGDEYAHLGRAAAAGSPDDAARGLAAAWAAHRPLLLPGYAAAVGPTLVRLWVELGEHDRAAEVAGELDALASKAPAIPSLAAAALRCRGVVDANAEPLLAAVALMESSPRVYERAGVLEDAAIVLASADPDGARRLVEAALDTYHALDARRDVERLNARTLAAGLKPRRARPDRPRFGWESLTPTELKVAEAVARGLTNGEVAADLFVSRHTVESHLKHIFTKLGVRSRTAVAGEVLRHAP